MEIAELFNEQDFSWGKFAYLATVDPQKLLTIFAIPKYFTRCLSKVPKECDKSLSDELMVANDTMVNFGGNQIRGNGNVMGKRKRDSAHDSTLKPKIDFQELMRQENEADLEEKIDACLEKLEELGFKPKDIEYYWSIYPAGIIRRHFSLTWPVSDKLVMFLQENRLSVRDFCSLPVEKRRAIIIRFSKDDKIIGRVTSGKPRVVNIKPLAEMEVNLQHLLMIFTKK